MIRVGIVVYDHPGSDKWAIMLVENDYNSGEAYFYKIVPRANNTWLRTGHQGGIAYESGWQCLLHVADLNLEMSVLHGRMQNVYSGQGDGPHANPTNLTWGPRAWVIRALRMLALEERMRLPICDIRTLPDLIERKAEELRRSGERFAML